MKPKGSVLIESSYGVLDLPTFPEQFASAWSVYWLEFETTTSLLLVIYGVNMIGSQFMHICDILRYTLYNIYQSILYLICPTC